MLFAPCLRGGIGDGLLANQMPADFSLVRGERLLVVPVLSIEQSLVGELLHGAANVEDRQGERGDENVRVFAGTQHFLTPRNLGQERELLFRGVNPKMLDRFLNTEKVPPHDLASELLARGRFKTTIHHQTRHVRDERRISVDSGGHIIGVIAEGHLETLIRRIDFACQYLRPIFHDLLLCC